MAQYTLLIPAVMVSCLLGCSSPPHKAVSTPLSMPSSTPHATPANWPAPTPEAGLLRGIRLPIESYLQTYPQLVSIQSARNSVQRDCMARFGFDFQPPAPDEAPPNSYDSANMGRRYGISDPVEAQRYGYELPPDQNRDTTSYHFRDSNAEMVYDLSVPKGMQPPALFHGKRLPAGGCVGESDRAVGSFDESLASKIDTQSWEQMKKDPRVTAVDRRWSGCMKSRGYRYSTPYDPLKSAYSAAMPRTQQVATALADVACKSSTGLITTYVAVESELQLKAISDNRAALDTARALNQKVTTEAAKLAEMK